MIPAFLMLAAAVLVWPGTRWVLCRASLPASDTDHPVSTPEGVAGEPAVSKLWWRRRAAVTVDPFAIAAAYDLLALCLRSGLPVSTSVTVVAQVSPPELAAPLHRAAELLTLGADSETAWTVAGDDAGRSATADETGFGELAALARRTARSGASLAAGVSELAHVARERARNRGVSRAERAGVQISGPLGLCFLPAFVCLGIAPVVVGLGAGLLGG